VREAVRSVSARPDLTADAALRSDSVLLGSPAREAGPTWVSSPVSAPEPGWRRPEELEKDVVHSAQVAKHLSALASVFRLPLSVIR